MFSTSVNKAPPAGSVRSSRRRARPLSNEGSIVQPKAKRQRSELTEHTFVPPVDAREMEMEETKSLKIASLPRRARSRETSGQHQEIAVRGKKLRSGDGSVKGDGSVVLTTNDTYTVSKLAALPDPLRTDPNGQQQGAIYSDTGYALSISHSKALVWPYAVNIHSPETFSFTLPYPSKNYSDPLPLGSLVSPAASSTEPGLVVVTPTTGKITYWESVASAATLDLIKQQRNGVETSIPGMLSGETIIQILNAESAGFVLAFSSGRLAYMSVRDGQGRPSISVQFLRGGSIGNPSGGIFGSIRNVLGSAGSRGDIAAVRAGWADKVGERDIVVMTTKGKIQSWTIHRGGHNTIQAEAESREVIFKVLKDTQPTLSDLSVESFEILDFTYSPQSANDFHLDETAENRARVLILTSLKDRHVSHYFLVEVTLRQGELAIGAVRPVKSYTTPASRTAIAKTRLYLPNPALVAYIVFDRAVVVLSMASQPDSPESQLLMENSLLPQSFEDVVDFRGDMDVEIVGSGMEEPHGAHHGYEDAKSRRHKSKHPAAVILVRGEGGGMIRVAATDITRLSSSRAQQVTAKSKLEQAVFFGMKAENPLSFAVRPELQFSAEEVGKAALELSSEIVKSKTLYIPATPASVETSLRKRADALRHLAQHLKATGVGLDRVTRWKLLWDAEKVQAASIIWKRYDASLKDRPEGQKRGLLMEIVESIHEADKSDPVPQAGELDRIRHWFAKDVWRVQNAIPWAYQVIKVNFKDGVMSPEHMVAYLDEANALVIGALDGAYQFRDVNLGLYGLQEEEVLHGVLQADYDGLPEFWTSTTPLVYFKQAQVAQGLVSRHWKKPDQGIDQRKILKIRDDLPALIDVAIRSQKERVQWMLAHNPQQLSSELEQSPTGKLQDDLIVRLATTFELGDRAIALAEKNSLLATLATVMMLEIHECSFKAQAADKVDGSSSVFAARIARLYSNVDRYFEVYGSSWATALYGENIEAGNIEYLLNVPDYQVEYLTSYLRDKPQYAKLAWLQEILRNRKFDEAAEDLLTLGLEREQDSWSKKIELSLGKLARLADDAHGKENEELVHGQVQMKAAENQLELIRVQDQTYEFVQPHITAAIDDKAEVQLALEAFVGKTTKRQRAFSLLLEAYMGSLVRHESMDALALIDLLTLMVSQDNNTVQENFRSQQFYLALRVCLYGAFDRDDSVDRNDRALIQRVIWRRCMLQGDWATINNTEYRNDEENDEQLRGTSLYLAFRACLKNRLFQSGSPIGPMSPRDVMGACTDELVHSLKHLDVDMRQNILKGMQTENDTLRVLIDTCRMENWYQNALDLARKDFRDEVDDETHDGQKMSGAAAQLLAIEKGIAIQEVQKAGDMLHSKARPLAGGRDLRSSGVESVMASIEY